MVAHDCSSSYYILVRLKLKGGSLKLEFEISLGKIVRIEIINNNKGRNEKVGQCKWNTYYPKWHTKPSPGCHGDVG